MTAPKETKFWVAAWLLLAGCQMVLAIVNAAVGEWHDALDSFFSAVIAAYIAMLTYQRDTAREFQRKIVAAVRRDSRRAA